MHCQASPPALSARRYYGRYNYDYGFVNVIPPVGLTTVRSKAVSVKDKLATAAGTVSSEATGQHTLAWVLLACTVIVVPQCLSTMLVPME